MVRHRRSSTSCSQHRVTSAVSLPGLFHRTSELTRERAPHLTPARVGCSGLLAHRSSSSSFRIVPNSCSGVPALSGSTGADFGSRSRRSVRFLRTRRGGPHDWHGPPGGLWLSPDRSFPGRSLPANVGQKPLSLSAKLGVDTHQLARRGRFWNAFALFSETLDVEFDGLANERFNLGPGFTHRHTKPIRRCRAVVTCDAPPCRPTVGCLKKSS